MISAVQLGLIVPDWRADVPSPALDGFRGRGGFHTMVRLPTDPRDAAAGDRGGGAATHAHTRWRKDSKPADFMDAVEALIFPELGGDGRARTFHAISMQLIGKGADMTCGSALEEAVWRCVAGKSLRWAWVQDDVWVFDDVEAAARAKLAAAVAPHGRLLPRLPRGDYTLFAHWPAGAEIDAPADCRAPTGGRHGDEGREHGAEDPSGQRRRARDQRGRRQDVDAEGSEAPPDAVDEPLDVDDG